MNKNILKWIVLSGLFVVPFVPFMVSGAFFFPFVTTKAFAWRIIVEIVFASWLVLAAFAPEYRPRKSIILYCLMAFILIIGLADLLGVSPVKSFWSNFERMEGYITMLHLGAFFLVIGSMFKAKEWKWWWNTSLFASFLMILYCLTQIGGLAEIHQGGVRLDGTLGNAAYLAVYMLFHVFIALIYLSRTKKNSFLMWVYSLLILGQVYILYLTATRGAILGLIGGVVIVSLLNIRNKESKNLRRVGGFSLVLLVLLVGSFYLLRHSNFVTESPVLSRFSNISIKEIKTEGRSFVWPMAVKGILEKPVLGWGQDNFNYVFNEHYDPKMYGLEPWFDRAHNIFLDWGIAGGLLGLLGYLSLYFALLYSVWHKSNTMDYVERTLITGLVAGYFFHNLFVFDQITSYILFLSLLAYVHSKTSRDIKKLAGFSLSENQAVTYVAAPFFLVLCFVLYTVNIRPMMTSSDLIKGLQISQTNGADKTEAIRYFKKAYSDSRLGRPEVVEWIGSSANNVLSGNISAEAKNEYFQFSKGVIEKQADDFYTDTRYQLLAGSYLVNTGFATEGLVYLERAKALTPGKQTSYFEIGSALLSQKDYAGALAVFKQAYDMAPGYKEAQIIYLIGAIYAGDEDLIKSLSADLKPEDIAGDSRVTQALLATKRFAQLINLLTINLEAHPTDPQAYVSLSASYLKAGNKTKSLEVLETLGKNLPKSKAEADRYIQGINDGSIK